MSKNTETKSRTAGDSTSELEVANISAHGLWLYWDGTEHFLPYDDFPWFREANVGQIVNVEAVSSTHAYWPDLDVDLSLDSIERPEKYPLKSRGGKAASQD